MKFQLVLQWLAPSVNDYDGIVAVEDLLIEKLTDASEVDGHDFGSGQANIFVLTNDPHQSFEEIRAILQGHRLWPDARLAFRQVNGTEYDLLWPPRATTFHVR